MIRGVGVAAALLCASLLEAQETSVLLGGSRARYADSLDGTAAFAAARLSVGRGLTAGELDATFSAFMDGEWAFQFAGQATALWRVRQSRGPYLGLAGGAALNAYRGGTPSGSLAAGPLAALTAGPSYVSLGVTGGGVRRVGATWSPLVSGSLRWQWTAGRGLSLDAGVTATGSDTNRLADLSVGLSAGSALVSISGVAGTRVGDLRDGPWGSLELVWQATPIVSLEASGGRYPRDLTGFTEGVYAQLGVRFATRRAPGSTPASLTVTPISGDRVRVAVRYRRAVTTVAITGEWNGWTEIPLRREGTWWVTELTLGSGVHRYALVADGEWTLPDGVKGVPDEFGGRVGELVIRSPA